MFTAILRTLCGYYAAYCPQRQGRFLREECGD
jgi:hypothetical protein